MRFLTAFPIFAATLFAQGAGSVQFRDWNPPPSNGKPVAPCSQLLSLTSYELSVITAVVLPSTTNAPEHCHVMMMAQPEINIEVNLPANWNGRFYMFGNGGWAGESFDAAGRIAEPCSRAPRRIRHRLHRYGPLRRSRTRGQLRAQSPEAARLRIPFPACYRRGREVARPHLLRRESN